MSHQDDPDRTHVFFRTPKSGPALITRMSVSTDGSAGVGRSDAPVITHDGRFVAFISTAANLDPDSADAAHAADVFLHDRDTDGNGVFDERDGTSTTRESVDVPYAVGEYYGTYGAGEHHAVSGDGRFVAFEAASDPTATRSVVFLRDRCLENGREVAGCTARSHDDRAVGRTDPLRRRMRAGLPGLSDRL